MIEAIIISTSWIKVVLLIVAFSLVMLGVAMAIKVGIRAVREDRDRFGYLLIGMCIFYILLIVLLGLTVIGLVVFVK